MRQRAAAGPPGDRGGSGEVCHNIVPRLPWTRRPGPGFDSPAAHSMSSDMTVAELAGRLEEIRENGGGDLPVRVDPPRSPVRGVYEREDAVEVHH